jgi:hypothetical protein
MLLCLSSGFNPRYRHDVLRSMAMPQGAYLRFRYFLSHVPENLKDELTHNRLAGKEACLAYLDRGDPQKEPEVVPCRAAKVIKTKEVGDFFILEFELGGFLIAKDVAEFNRQIRTLAGNLPRWQDAKLVGKFCERLSGAPSSLVPAKGVSDWQGLCKTLAGHGDFAGEPFFYRVEGLYPAGKDTAVPISNAVFTVEAGRLYDLTVIHFSAKGGEGGVTNSEMSWIVGEADDKVFSFVSNKLLAIDSRYDEKTFRVRAVTTSQALDSRLTLNRHQGVPGKAENLIWDFDLQVHVEPRWSTMIWQGLAVGAGVAAQGLVITWNSPNIQNKELVSVLVVAAALFTGLAASFGLRKP